MPSENNKVLQNILAAPLKARGFKKDGPTWRKDFPEAIAVLNIQGSQWGPAFYINLGTYFRALGSAPSPNEYDCHIRCRLHDLAADRSRLVAILDFGQNLDFSLRARELEAVVVEHGLPWLERCSNKAGAANFVATLPATSPFVAENARIFLDTARA